ncbi:universal stress protein [Bhargavaea cecembensis]|uniref:universal stress protein n=1 Tax=Bhargavaea cecembensis TaxID=394098 RepID=UPI00058C6B0A|nr:universal stress protein [Bhargavaea cecembensis]
MYKKILVAVDGSDHSKRAAEHVASLAASTGASADMLYILDYDQSRPKEFENVPKEELEGKITDRLDHIFEVFRNEGIGPGLKIQYGEPGPTIVKFCNAEDYDLVVVGSRGLNAFQEMVLGSVSHKVAKRVECPVLLVK